MNTDRTSRILSKIREHHITPIPRWHIRTIRFVWLVLVALGIVAFGVALSLVALDILDLNEILPTLLSDPRSRDIVDVIPMAALIIAILTGTGVYFAVRHLPRSYRYSVVSVVALLVGIASFIGMVSYVTEMSHSIDDSLGHALPWYDAMRMQHMRVWMRPDRGFLAGRIVRIDSNEHLVDIEDFSDNSPWTVHTETIPPPERIGLRIGDPIRIIGVPIRPGEFRAIGIRRRHSGPPSWFRRIFGLQNPEPEYHGRMPMIPMLHRGMPDTPGTTLDIRP